MELTAEQQQVVNHPLGRHGRVLSVAGSGKTTTMACRVKKLVTDLEIAPQQIQVLMFNRFAKEEFASRLYQVGLPRPLHPKVNTFHSYAYRLWQDHPGRTARQDWFGDNEEQAILTLRRAYNDLAAALPETEQEDLPELEQCEQALSLWKSKLITPNLAGYKGRHAEFIVSLYKNFEERRTQAGGYTFDDFVPYAVQVLAARTPEDRPRLRHIIVDEYQDINYGQQYLLELLAENGADLMVVGDDDQTIYEWRGARPEFIIEEFQQVFANKPHSSYKLTRSFRFGYPLAQCANNVISHNPNRVSKDLLAWNPAQPGQINLITPQDEADDINRRLAEEVIAMVTRQNVNPGQIRVLARTYAQLNPLTTQFILKQVPHRTIGQKPLFDTPEVQTLLTYVTAAEGYDQPVSPAQQERLLLIANRPNRYLSRSALRQRLEQALRHQLTTEAALSPPAADEEPEPDVPPLSRQSLQAMAGLKAALRRLHRARTAPEPNCTAPLAGPLLEKADDAARLSQHYADYYGAGERSNNKISSLLQAKTYAHAAGLPWPEFVKHIKTIDSSLGLPPEQTIACSTIHRVKGLEFDYVIIPDCREGAMPIMARTEDPTCDRSQPPPASAAADWIESERRLFYVALTRARKAVTIGTPQLPAELAARLNLPARSKSAASKASRFLEEIELDAVNAAALALTAALEGNCQPLEKLADRYGGHHRLLNLLKNQYSPQLPIEIQETLNRLRLRPAERAFAYQQNYDSPDRRQPGLGSEPLQPALWGHLQRAG